MKAVLLFMLLAVAYKGVAAANSTPEPMVYRYWDWSITKSRDDYQVAALTLALEKTLDTYGPYQVIRVQQPFSSEGVLREIQSGEVINLHAVPARVREHKLANVTEDISIAVEIPLMNGLLGYRQLIVRKDKLEDFQKITEAAQLKTLVAGQGNDWEDVYIYRHNNYAVNHDGDYLALINMLLAKRFDYLPMSIVEIDNLLAQAPETNQLAVVENLMLYYPLPLYFYVSKRQPQLAERLKIGLQIAQKDGSLDALLHNHFAEEIAFLEKGQAKLLILDNPSVPANQGLRKPRFVKPSSKKVDE